MMNRLPAFMIGLLLFTLLAPTIAQPPTQPVTLTFWDGTPSREAALQEIIARFEAQHPDIRIELTTVGLMRDTLVLAFEAGDGPDIMSFTRTHLYPFVENGHLYPLNDLPGFDALLSYLPGEVPSKYRHGDHIYSLPRVRNRTAPYSLGVNLALYREAGIVDQNGDPILPRTWDEVVANSRRIHAATGAFGLVNDDEFFPGFDACWYSSTVPELLVWGFDIRNGMFRASADECNYRIVEYVVQMIDEGLIPIDLIFDPTFSANNAKTLFATGRAVHIIEGHWSIPWWTENYPEFTDYVLATLPLVIGEEPLSFFYFGGTGDGFAINADTLHLDAAWLFLQYLYSEDVGRFITESTGEWTMFTPGNPADYNMNPNLIEIVHQWDWERIGPPLQSFDSQGVHLRDFFPGPTPEELFLQIISGAAEDVDRDGTINRPDIRAALTHYDLTAQTALDLAIANARENGHDVSIATFVVPDWDQTADYIAPFTSSE